jgi:hypothetical protein
VCARDSVGVHADASFSDTIRFEIPQRSTAAHLCRRLRSRWLESLEPNDGVGWIVSAWLRAEASDLATLLRDVEKWVAERGLNELWFQLDGRSYLLRSPHVNSSTATAA